MKLLYEMQAGATAGERSSSSLDLSGLLNVLDGVVDTPGRIVVFCTSDPTHLDAALTRPGRFSTRVRMDYIRLGELISMTGLHFGEVHPSRDDVSLWGASQLASLPDKKRAPGCCHPANVALVDDASRETCRTDAHTDLTATRSPSGSCDGDAMHGTSDALCMNTRDGSASSRAERVGHRTTTTAAAAVEGAVSALPSTTLASGAVHATSAHAPHVVSLSTTVTTATSTTTTSEAAEPAESEVARVLPAIRASMTQARVVHRVLSVHQENRLRRCLAQLEAEDAANRQSATPQRVSGSAYDGKSYSGVGGSAAEDSHTESGASTRAATQQVAPGARDKTHVRRRYNFYITPSEIELLCTSTYTLDEFIERFEKYVRREVMVTEFTA